LKFPFLPFIMKSKGCFPSGESPSKSDRVVERVCGHTLVLCGTGGLCASPECVERKNIRGVFRPDAVNVWGCIGCQHAIQLPNKLDILPVLSVHFVLFIPDCLTPSQPECTASMSPHPLQWSRCPIVESSPSHPRVADVRHRSRALRRAL